MSDSLYRQILNICDCQPRHGEVPKPAVFELLPGTHRRLLEAHGSITAFHGYFRLLPLAGP